jgi:anti-sigma regulatory factor (Ser/Thr protein kinase)
MTSGYRHDAFPYAGRDAFITSSADFLRAGAGRDERMIMVAERDRLIDVRDELGTDAAAVTFVDMAVAGRNPGRILPVFQQFVHAEESGRAMRGLGEAMYPGRSAAALAEVQLHELLLNSAHCQGWDLWLRCPYDTTELDATGLAAMQASHPQLAGEAAPNFRADGHAHSFFATELSPVPHGARSCHLILAGRDDLAAARQFVRRAASDLGLGGTRLDDLITAVNEVVTNSMRHGDGAAVVSVWRADGTLTCDVRDGGWIRDLLVGRMVAAASSTGGRGLWLVNHLCDLVQIRSSPAGTSVRMYFDV